jgi:hypothetical protein
MTPPTSSLSRGLRSRLLLSAIGVLPLYKQREDPADRKEFERRVLELSAALVALFRDREAQALAEIGRVVRRDWPTLGAEARAAALDDLATIVRSLPTGTQSRLIERVTEAALRIGRDQRTALRRGRARLDIAPRANAAQLARATDLVGHTGAFAGAEYGRRADRLRTSGATAVAAAVAAGRDAEEIAERLGILAARQVQQAVYFTETSAAILNRARTDAALAAFVESKVDRYRVVAVLDEVTCTKCRFMHGHTFPVATGDRILSSAAAAGDPDAVQLVNPFLRSGRDDSGQPILYIPGPRATRRVVARILASGEGEAGATGRYVDAWRDEELTSAGIGPPPYHPLCRCGVVPA